MAVPLSTGASKVREVVIGHYTNSEMVVLRTQVHDF